MWYYTVACIHLEHSLSVRVPHCCGISEGRHRTTNMFTPRLSASKGGDASRRAGTSSRKHAAAAAALDRENVLVEVESADSTKRRLPPPRRVLLVEWIVVLWLVALTVWLVLLTHARSPPGEAALVAPRTLRNRHVRFNTSLGKKFEVYAPGMVFERVRRYELCCRTATALVCGPHTGVRGRVVAPKIVRVEVRSGDRAGAECVFRWEEQGD